MFNVTDLLPIENLYTFSRFLLCYFSSSVYLLEIYQLDVILDLFKIKYR